MKGYEYIDVVGKGCEGWINLFFNGEILCLVDNIESAERIKGITPRLGSNPMALVDKAIWNKIRAVIPANEPKPCDCCTTVKAASGEYWAADCDCKDKTRYGLACRWCANTIVIERFEHLLEENPELEQLERECM